MGKVMWKTLICVLIVALFCVPNVILVSTGTGAREQYTHYEVDDAMLVQEDRKDDTRDILQYYLENRQGGLLGLFFRIVRDLLTRFEGIPGDDELDQSQEQADDYYKIYGDHWFAQSFTPQKDRITRFQIQVGKHRGLISGVPGYTMETRGRCVDIPLLWFKVEIRGSLHGPPLFIDVLPVLEVPWRQQWIEFDCPDIDYRLNPTYYIVVYATGGDSKNYYKWSCGGGDPYSGGIAYSSSNGGRSWNARADDDFCFRVFGADIERNPPDGVVERWAVMFDINPGPGGNIGFVKDCLVHHGWEEDHIKMLFEATYDDVQSAISWINSMDLDQDDIFLLCSNTHGNYGCIDLADQGLYYRELDSWLDNCSANIFYSISACHSGSALPILGQKGRIIMSACSADETGFTAWLLVFLYDAFAKKDCDLNNDGWVSAEEAFPFAKEWTEEYNEIWNPEHPIHPQMYDDYPGELLITQV